MERLIATIKLMAKTGLFFANCDGEYAQTERDFIEGYVKGIENVGSIDDELKAQVYDSINHTYTLEQVVQDTKALVKDFNDDERNAILAALKGFVNKVIRADHKIDKAEQANYIEWKKQLEL